MPLYSYSRIGCFEQCPQKYKFQYIDRIKIDEAESIESFMGKMVHETLEESYKLAEFGRPPSWDEMSALYDRLWGEKRPEEFKIVHEDETETDYINVGRNCLKRYHDRFYPFDDGITLGREMRVNISLDGDGKYKLQGFIDRLTKESDGRLRIQDYKTSKSLYTQMQADEDSQLALYQIAVEENWPDNKGVELVWHYLRFDERLISRRSKEQLTNLRKKYIEKIKRIEEAESLGNFPPNESTLCDWCEFISICPAKGGGGSAEDSVQEELELLPDDELTTLVDRYIDLDRGKKEVEKELKKIKAVLTSQAAVGTSTLFRATGGGGLIVGRSKELALPTKTNDSATVAKIGEILREHGFYEEYSEVNINSLQKALDRDELPEPLRDLLKELRALKESVSVRIKK